MSLGVWGRSREMGRTVRYQSECGCDRMLALIRRQRKISTISAEKYHQPGVFSALPCYLQPISRGIPGLEFVYPRYDCL